MLNYMEKEAKSCVISIEAPWENSESGSLADTLVDSALPVAEVAERNFLLAQMRAALERLPVKERLALSGVYIDEQNPHQVATNLEITPSHLSRLQKQGIRRVRGMLSRLMGEMKKF
jgi:RNA polymerase sporulation-specific sigma factor